MRLRRVLSPEAEQCAWVCRLQDVLPLAVFMKAHKRDGELKNKSSKAA